MKTFGLIIMLSALCNFATGEKSDPGYNSYYDSTIVIGSVYDRKTHEPIPSAAVYFDGTSTGTLTDNNGMFKLDVSKNFPMPLTISALGYYSETLNNEEYSNGKPVKVYMRPKVFELKEVVINAKAREKARKANMILFKREFLGTTDNALMCEIVNEEDITFSSEPGNDTLKVFASKPIIINNNGLGYKISYFLDRFEYCRKDRSFLYKGSVYFNDDMSDKSKKQLFEKKRKYAFLGSRLQLFRSIWANDLKSTGFVVRNPANEALDYSDYVLVLDTVKFLKCKGSLDICYYSSRPSSRLVFLKSHVYFDKMGYFDPSGISFEGQLSRQRIGDLLPFEYTIK